MPPPTVWSDQRNACENTVVHVFCIDWLGGTEGVSRALFVTTDDYLTLVSEALTVGCGRRDRVVEEQRWRLCLDETCLCMCGVLMKIGVKADLCQGHGRCFGIAPELFGADELGNSFVIGDGSVASDEEPNARLAEDNCPERAVWIED